MKRKILVITSRFLDISDNKQDCRFFVLLKALAAENDVHYLYTQSMFIKEEAVKEIEHAGIKVLSLNALKEREPRGAARKFEAFMVAEAFDVVLLNSYFTAKYYIPVIHANLPGAVIVIDAGKSQYFSELSFAAKATNPTARIGLLMKAEIDRMREVSIYSYVDVVVADEAEKCRELEREVHGVSVVLVPKPGHNGAGDADIARAVDELSASLKKKGTVNGRVDIVVPGVAVEDKHVLDIMKTANDVLFADDAQLSIVSGYGDNAALSSVERYNEGLRKISADYGLLKTTGTIVPLNAVKAMLHCAQSNPLHGIIAARSNNTLGFPIKIDDLPGFYPAHYAANFGCWMTLKKLDEHCLLFRRELLDRIGLLDTRYTLLSYALFDYCLKATQAGFRTMLVNEAFVYYSEQRHHSRTMLEKDKQLLFDKWCDKGVEFLEGLNEGNPKEDRPGDLDRGGKL